LAWVYLETKLDALRPFGLRGAYDIRDFLDQELASKDPATSARATAILAEAATATQMAPDALRFVFERIGYDPATDFLYIAGD